MALNIFNRLSLPTNNAEKPDMLTRFAGGHERDNHVYISGYWQFIVWPPATIFGSDSAEVQQWLHCTAEGFTPHSRSITKAEVPGQGGLGASFISGQAITRSFSVTFREYQRLPIISTLTKWAAIDPYLGVSPIPGANWAASAYKGAAMAILTKPTGANASGSNINPITPDDIEEVFYYIGVMPETPGVESLASDISGNDSIVIQATFSFDGYPLTRREIDLDSVVSVLTSSLSGNYSSMYTTYRNNVTATTPLTVSQIS